MKKLILPLAAMLIAFTGCKKECEYYMEGKKCDSEVREKYYGTYVGTSTMTAAGNGQTETQTVASNVTAQSDGKEWVNLGSGIKAQLVTASTFEIPLQIIISGQNSAQIQGSGSFGQNTLGFAMVWIQNNNNFAYTFNGNLVQ